MLKKISSYSNRQIFIFLLIVVVGVILIKMALKSDQAKNITYSLFGAKSDDGSSVSELSSARKDLLNDKAQELRDAIYSSVWTAQEILEEIQNYNDAEFIYLYERYIDKFGENPYCAVDWEVLPETDADEIFMARAKKLKLPIKNAGLFESC